MKYRLRFDMKSDYTWLIGFYRRAMPFGFGWNGNCCEFSVPVGFGWQFRVSRQFTRWL